MVGARLRSIPLLFSIRECGVLFPPHLGLESSLKYYIFVDASIPLVAGVDALRQRGKGFCRTHLAGISGVHVRFQDQDSIAMSKASFHHGVPPSADPWGRDTRCSALTHCRLSLVKSGHVSPPVVLATRTSAYTPSTESKLDILAPTSLIPLEQHLCHLCRTCRLEHDSTNP